MVSSAPPGGVACIWLDDVYIRTVFASSTTRVFPSSWFVKLHEHIHRDDLPCCNISKSCCSSSMREAPHNCVSLSSASCASTYRGVIPVLPYSWFVKLHGHTHYDYLSYERLLLAGRNLLVAQRDCLHRWSLGAPPAAPPAML